MGIYDRDYMKANPPRKQSPRKPSLWQRIRFHLWLLFRKK
jgi:hypothetical protein